MWHDVEQNDEGGEWLPLRAGKITGSAISKIMANEGKAFGEPAKKLAVDIAVERLTGTPASAWNSFSNGHLERGHEQEPVARMLYEQRTFCEVMSGGFFDNGKTGCSPDGLVNDDGIIEIKSRIPSMSMSVIRHHKIPSEYRWQCWFNLKESGREWLDYVNYCEWMPEPHNLTIVNITPDHDIFKRIDERIEEFETLIRENMHDIRR